MLNDRDDCQNKTKVFAELQSGYDANGQRNWSLRNFLFTAPKDNWLELMRPPYNVRWYDANSPQVTRNEKKATGVYLEATEVSSGDRKDTYIGKM